MSTTFQGQFREKSKDIQKIGKSNEQLGKSKNDLGKPTRYLAGNYSIHLPRCTREMLSFTREEFIKKHASANFHFMFLKSSKDQASHAQMPAIITCN